MLNIVEVQDRILQSLRDSIPQRVEEQAILNEDTVLRDSVGKIRSYVAVSFGDIQFRSGGQTFAGSRYDDYDLPVYIQVVASTQDDARKIAYDNVLSALMGEKFKWTGQIRKRPGGALWPLIASNGATEAYLAPVSFGVTVQMADA